MREVAESNLTVRVRRYTGTEPVLVVDDAAGRVLVRPVEGAGQTRTVTCPAAMRMLVGTVPELAAVAASVEAKAGDGSALETK